MATNQIVITGHLGAAPAFLASKSNGAPYAVFSLANNERYRRDGQILTRTNWTPVFAFGPLAETLVHLNTGCRVTVLGSLQTETRFREGGGRYTAFWIKARSIDFVDPRQEQDAVELESEPVACAGTDLPF